MLVNHFRAEKKVSKEIHGVAAAFLRNKHTWFSQYMSRQSRYEGWFLGNKTTLPHSYFKMLERIAIVPYENLTPERIDVRRQSFTLHWSSTSLSVGVGADQSLAIMTNQEVPIRLTLDMRPIYKFPDFGRVYSVEAKEGLLISYLDASLIGPLYLHIRSESNTRIVSDGNWIHCNYPHDAARNSGPTELYSYSLLPLVAKRLNLGCGFSPEEALNASREAEHIVFTESEAPEGDAQAVAQVCVADALQDLTTAQGIYAGFPWFHQFWSRDELLTGLGLPRVEQLLLIERYLALPLLHGELPTFAGSGTTCADGVGWLALLIREYGELPSQFQEKCITFFKAAIEGLAIERRTPSGLIYSGHNATWMDTIGRQGFRLEIQCMYALIHECLYKLTGKNEYLEKQKEILGTIRHFFLTGKKLFDGLEDTMQPDPKTRPNIFLAYLLQPDLLEKEAWTHCFETTLKTLEMPWGGLASLDPHDPAYQAYSTGENNLSYHLGDSWFFVNNLAALALKRHGEDDLQNLAEKIMQASTEEVLWKGFLGCPGEIASAADGETWGCGIQGFSGGAYLKALQ